MNVYYQPRAFGLRLLNNAYFAKLDTLVAIWMRDDRKIFWGFWDVHHGLRIAFEDVGLDELGSTYHRERCANEINAWILGRTGLDDTLWDQGQALLIGAWRNA